MVRWMKSFLGHVVERNCNQLTLSHTSSFAIHKGELPKFIDQFDVLRSFWATQHLRTIGNSVLAFSGNTEDGWNWVGSFLNSSLRGFLPQALNVERLLQPSMPDKSPEMRETENIANFFQSARQVKVAPGAEDVYKQLCCGALCACVYFQFQR